MLEIPGVEDASMSWSVLADGGALTLLVAVLVAGYAPAWRASRIDPNVALRYE